MVASGLRAHSRASADAEAVIRQAQRRARRRGRRMTAMVAVTAMLVIAAFASLAAEGLVTGRAAGKGWTGTVPPGARAGTIVGVIEGFPGALTLSMPMPTVGGIVTLLTGPPPATSIRGVIPRPAGGAVVAIERIWRGQRFSFREPAGAYVLSVLAGDRESGFFRCPPVAVALRAGATVRLVTGTACS